MRSHHLSSLLALGLLATATLAGCAAPSPAATGGSGSGTCGQLDAQPAVDPDGVISTLPESAQAAFDQYPNQVLASAWADYEGSDKPYSIGLSSIALMNSFATNASGIIETTVEDLEADGVTDGKLVFAVMPDASTQSPAEQIKGYEQMVSSGVDGIVMVPLSGDAMIDSVNAAGEKGIPTVSINTFIDSPYAINVQINQGQHTYLSAKGAFEAIGGSGNVLVVRGIPGESNDTASMDVFNRMLENCPDINVAGEVISGYSPAATKTAILQFLASHPEQIDMVYQVGVVGPGIITAFEQAGRPVPVINFSGLQAGDAAWWADHLADGYTTTGTITTGTMVARLSIDVLLRVLNGEKPITNTVVFAPPVVTADNVSDYVVPGSDVNSSDEVLADASDVATADQIGAFFSNPK